MKYTGTFLAILSFLSVSIADAQNNASPYSSVGIGDLENEYYDRSTGLASAGVSLFSGRFIYQANPASLSKLDDRYFSVQLAARFKGITYSGQTITPGLNSYSSDFQVKSLQLAVKVKPWWGATLGLSPFSSSNYSFNTEKTIIGGSNITTTAHYDGSGGLNQVYFSNGIKLNKNFSLGLQSSFLFGSFALNETLNASDAVGAVITTKRNIYMNKFYFKGGLQYDTKLSKNWKLALGAIGSAKTNLDAEYTLNVIQGNQILVNDKKLQNSYFKLPVTYTLGGSVVYKNRLTLALDYQEQQWNTTQFKGLNYSLANSNRISAGIEYANRFQYYDQFFEKFYLQAGTYYANSYLNINNNQLKDYGLTLGVGVNAKRTALSYQVNFQYGQRGTTNNGLVKENYTMLNFTLLYRDLWYTKAKKYD